MTSCAKRRLFVDIETFSSVDIKAGAFRYMEAPDFEILLIAYAWDNGPVRVVEVRRTRYIEHPQEYDLAEREMMREVIAALLDPSIVKVAHNSAFERAAFSRYLERDMPPEEWEDTMVLAAYNGLPLSLEGCGAALGLEAQKIREGTLLINYFCKPCKATKANGGRTRNLPGHAPDKWERFSKYCARDVEVCQAIWQRLHRFPVTDFERRIWALDARINERGVLVDLELAAAAVEVDKAYKAECVAEMKLLTGLANPGSVQQLTGWLQSRGLFPSSLDKEAVAGLLAEAKDPTTIRVLQLRQLTGNTSTKKYEAMLAGASSADARIRGLTQYYGASRTGRWAGRMVQLQNLPQNHLAGIGAVRELLRQKDLETLEMIYGDVGDVLKQLIRTALIAKPGHTFLVADFSAIEARVVNYLADETWANEAFAAGEDIYCKTASMTFGVPVVKHGVNGHLRQRGKVMVLGLGYGMGAARFIEYSAGYGIKFEPGEAESIVLQWRQTSSAIPRFWREAENAARAALENPGKTAQMRCGVKYRKDADALRCQLPSGRWLSYWGARIEDGSIVYMGQGGQGGGWMKKDTWGGKLVENIVQAYARDCLAVAMDRLAAAGFQICFHVHDEVVAEAPEGSDWREMAAIMGQPIDWAPGLLLRADGYDTPFYMKD